MLSPFKIAKVVLLSSPAVVAAVEPNAHVHAAALLSATVDLRRAERTHFVLAQTVPLATAAGIEAAATGVVHFFRYGCRVGPAPVKRCEFGIGLEESSGENGLQMWLHSHGWGRHESLRILHLLLCLFFLPLPLALSSLLVEQRPDAYATCFGAEMAAKSVCAGESATAAPLFAGRERSLANEFLFARMQTFVAFAIVLARKGFATDSADKRSFVGVGA